MSVAHSLLPGFFQGVSIYSGAIVPGISVVYWQAPVTHNRFKPNFVHRLFRYFIYSFSNSLVFFLHLHSNTGNSRGERTKPARLCETTRIIRLCVWQKHASKQQPKYKQTDL